MRLTRSRDGYLAGVAEGIAQHFGWDPSLVRIVWLVSVLAGGVGIGLYLLLWWIMPREDRIPAEPTHAQRLTRTVADRKVAGVFGGIAYHYGKDPTLVRLLGALLIPCSVGLFLLAYLAAAVVMPQIGRATIQATRDF